MERLSVPAAAVDEVVVPVPSEILQEGESGIGSHGFDALLVGVYENKRLIFVAKVKDGFVPRIRDETFPALKALQTASVPSRICPRKKPRGGASR